MPRASSAPKKKTPARWPFWLLVAAWFCANVPQRLTFEWAVWMANGRHFSHQERLRADVVALLGGKKTNPLVALAKSGPVQLPVTPAPAADSLKKIDLYAAEMAEPIGPFALTLAHPIRSWRVPEYSWPEPSVPPPKMAVVS
jgi:hypothetical protein